MSRVILHVDANSFYASVECAYDPDIRGKAVAVCGDPEARHGIVLTSTREAKSKGVKTGMAIWQAKQVCPDLIVLPPDYELYLHYSHMMRDILMEYSDNVEAFGLDENWCDVSTYIHTVQDGGKLADEIRQRMYQELGITVSVGVANNKVFAKLGSDMKKPDATTIIDPLSFREKIWDLPASDLLYCGPKATSVLNRRCIHTIGELAQADTGMLQSALGKCGLMLKLFAMGMDEAPVMHIDAESAIKSIGNSTTTPVDMLTIDDARCVFYLLAESVGARLREHGFRSKTVAVSVRDTNLNWCIRQRTIKDATNITDEIADTVMDLFLKNFTNTLPLRSVGIHCGNLVPDTWPIQLDMFGDTEARLRKERLDASLDGIRARFGHQVIQRGIVLMNRRVAEINPKDEHTIHPVAYFAG